MTLEERQREATDMIKDIELRLGLRLVAVLQAEQYNASAAMIKAAVALEPVSGWKMPVNGNAEKVNT